MINYNKKLPASSLVGHHDSPEQLNKYGGVLVCLFHEIGRLCGKKFAFCSK